MNKITIKSLTLRPVAGYPAQYRRAWTLALTPQNVARLQELYANTAELQPEHLVGIAGDMLKMAGAAVPVQIQGDWAAARFVFQLDLETGFDAQGTKLRQTLHGYTAPAEQAASEADFRLSELAPELRFFINRSEIYRDPVPLLSDTQPNKPAYNHLLSESSWKSVFEPQQAYRMRPEDMFSAMNWLDLKITGNTTDMRTALTGVPAASSLSNAVPAFWLHRVLEAYRDAGLAFDPDSAWNDLLATARGMAAEDSIVRDPWLSTTSTLHGAPRGFFTLEDLIAIAGSAQAVPLCVFSAAGPTEERYNSFDDSSKMGLLARTLLVAGNALAVESGYCRAHFTLEPEEGTGRPKLTVYDLVRNRAWDFDSEKRLRASLENFLLKDWLGDALLDFSASVVLSPELESSVWLEWGGGQEAVYGIPSFADALLSPLIASTQQEQTEVATELRQLLGLLSEPLMRDS